MHRLLPHLILEEYAARRLKGQLTAAGMFADMSGFSAMTDELMTHGQHGAEVLAAVLRRAFEPMIQSVYEQGGFVATQAGDAFTALFPVRQHPQEAIQRALTAALAIQAHIQAHSRPQTPYGEFSIAVKIGLAFGQAAWGILESRDGSQAVCYFKGAAIDESARAEHYAGRGEVILAPSVLEIARERVQVEPIEECYRLTGYHGTPTPPKAVNLPPFDLQLASRFFPLELLTQRFAGEFRQVVGLFAGMPEIAQENELEEVMQTVFDLQKRYGGLVKLYFGDKGPHILVIWGAPVAYENDVERALSFVLELRARARTTIHAGVTYRIAHAGCIGSALSEEYATFGRGVNLAARFMTSAPAGEIWVDEFIVRRARASFDFAYIEARPFKGFSQPQKVFSLLGRKPAREIEYTGRLAGRQAELQRLRAFVQPLFEGQPAGLIVVFGEAGMGKSRLVYEFLNQIPADRAAWFLAQTDPLLRESLNPFRYWLRHYFGIAAQGGEERNKRSFEARLDELLLSLPEGELVERLERARSFLGALVGLRWPGSLYEQFDAEARYQNTLLGLTALLQAESLRQPVILFLEDIHWLDEDSAAYLPRLLRALTSAGHTRYPVALIATSRPDEISLPLADLPHAEILLERLDPEGLKQLAESLLNAPAGSALLHLLEARAEGNPFFAEQLLRYAQEEGLLAQKNGVWELTQTRESPTLPLDVNALLIARLDRLAQDVRETVQNAAILGREFEVRVLSGLLERQELATQNLSRALLSAQREAIWAALSEHRYLFRHALMWDAAYHMQLHARRQMLHAAAVETLEALYATHLSNHYGELAYHAERAHLNEKARFYLRRAAETAQSAYQNRQAEDYYTRALALTPAEDLPTRYDLLLARLDVYQTQGRYEDCLRDLQTLHDLAVRMDQPERLLEVLIRKTEVIYDKGDSPQTLAIGLQALALAESIGSREKPISIYNLLSNAAQRLGGYDQAQEFMQKGLALTRALGDLRMESKLLNTVGMFHAERNEMQPAEACFRQSLTLARQAGDLRLQARPLANLGLAAIRRGNFLEARQYSQESLALARQIGARIGEALILDNLGFIEGSLGNYARASEYAEAGLRIAREIGSRYHEANALINLSAYLGALGENEAATRAAREGLQIARQIGEQSSAAWGFTYLGHSLLRTSQWDEARQAYQNALRIRRELDQPVLATEPLAGLAEIALQSGETSTAQSLVEEILAILERTGSPEGADDPLRVYAACLNVLHQTNDPRLHPLLQSAQALLQARATQIPDEHNRQNFLANHANQVILRLHAALEQRDSSPTVRR